MVHHFGGHVRDPGNGNGEEWKETSLPESGASHHQDLRPLAAALRARRDMGRGQGRVGARGAGPARSLGVGGVGGLWVGLGRC